MTLPYREVEENKNKRKYQCFVCGVMFLEYHGYKEHIKAEHEEGREYVCCPMNHCGAPVRDLKIHFKVKHPAFEMPKVNGPIRAIIWKDQSSRRGKKGELLTTKKPKFRTGYYESTKMGNKIYYRSGLEEKVYECLDADMEVASFDAEPFEIPYLFEGEGHIYKPDLFIQFVDGRKEIWEVKPANQTLLSKNQSKWHACGKVCKARGWEMVVMTEIGIGKLKKKVKAQQQMLLD